MFVWTRGGGVGGQTDREREKERRWDTVYDKNRDLYIVYVCRDGSTLNLRSPRLSEIRLRLHCIYHIVYHNSLFVLSLLPTPHTLRPQRYIISPLIPYSNYSTVTLVCGRPLLPRPVQGPSLVVFSLDQGLRSCAYRSTSLTGLVSLPPSVVGVTPLCSASLC